jgi:hypothetical protein
LIPLATGFMIKGNIYGIDGLADDILFLALSTAIMGPFAKIVNASYRFNKIYYSWKNRKDSKL